MLKNSNLNIIQFLVIALFAVAPFVMSVSDSEMTEVVAARTLPPFVATAASALRWAILGILTAMWLMHLNVKKGFKISRPVYLLSLFYLVQFVYAVVDGTDYIRFFALSILALIIPPVIGGAIGQNRRITKTFVYCIAFFLLFSIVLNGHVVLSGQRFFGFVDNANAYGISTVFWLVILLLVNEHHSINKKLFYVLVGAIFLTMLFSGSRNALVGVILIFVLQYYNKLKSVAVSLIMFILLFIATSYFIDLSFVMERFENLSGAAADSGRSAVWERAYSAINNNFWLGNGMHASEVFAGTGNMHNCYIRFVLHMGIIFTVLTLLMYFLSILSVFAKKNKVPLILPGYLIIYALMNVGEDYFVGLGSSAFIYMLFIYGFINYFLTKPNEATK